MFKYVSYFSARIQDDDWLWRLFVIFWLMQVPFGTCNREPTMQHVSTSLLWAKEAQDVQPANLLLWNGLNILSTFVESRCWNRLTPSVNNVGRCWDMLRRVWLRLNFVSISSQYFHCFRNVVEHAQAHCNYTTYKMAASKDAPEFSEELQEKGSECQSENKKRRADSGKDVKVSKPKRWSSEVVHALSFPSSKSNTIRAATHLRLNSIDRTRDGMQPRRRVIWFAVSDLMHLTC